MKNKKNIMVDPHLKCYTGNQNQKIWEWMTLEYSEEQDRYFLINTHHGGDHTINCGPGNGYAHAPNGNRLGHEAL